MTWIDDAACAASELPADAWTDRHPDRQWGMSAANRAALAVCNECPVARQCLRVAMKHESGHGLYHRAGIWGGTTPAQRVALTQRLKEKATT